MTVDRNEVGRRIKAARRAAKLTQRELADRVGLQNGQSISNYERGKQEVEFERLARIADETDRPLSYFLGDAVGVSPGQVEEAEELFARLEASLLGAVDLVGLLRGRLPLERGGGGQPGTPRRTRRLPAAEQ